MSDFELVRLEFDEAGVARLRGVARSRAALHRVLEGQQPVPGRVEAGSHRGDRAFGMCLGLAAVGADTLLLATRYQIWRLENGSAGSEPRTGTITSFCRRRRGRPGPSSSGTSAVRTTDRRLRERPFSCLSIPSPRLTSNRPGSAVRLKPRTRGRCELSGLAPRGRPAVVTSGSRSDSPRVARAAHDGGVVLSVPAADVVPAVFRCLRRCCATGCCGSASAAPGSLRRSIWATAAYARATAPGSRAGWPSTAGRDRGESGPRGMRASRACRSPIDCRREPSRSGIFVVDLATGSRAFAPVLRRVAEVHALAVLPGSAPPRRSPSRGRTCRSSSTVRSV